MTAIAPCSAELFTDVTPERVIDTTSDVSPVGAGHAPALQDWDMLRAGHAAPPQAGGVATLRFADSAPVPHVTSHADHADHAETVQLTAHRCRQIRSLQHARENPSGEFSAPQQHMQDQPIKI